MSAKLKEVRNAVRHAIEGGAVLKANYAFGKQTNKHIWCTVGPYQTATGTGQQPQYASYWRDHREYAGTSAYRAAANFVSLVGITAAARAVEAARETK